MRGGKKIKKTADTNWCQILLSIKKGNLFEMSEWNSTDLKLKIMDRPSTETLQRSVEHILKC